MDAIAAYIEFAEWQLGEIQAGIAELDSGREVSHEVSKWGGHTANRSGYEQGVTAEPVEFRIESLGRAVHCLGQRCAIGGSIEKVEQTAHWLSRDLDLAVPERGDVGIAAD